MKNQLLKIHYETELRENFIKSSFRLTIDKTTGKILEAYLTSYRYGVITIKDGSKEVHRWENEDEAKSVSVINKYFTAVLSDGIVTDRKFEIKLIESIKDDIMSIVPENEKETVLNCLEQVRDSFH